MRNTGTQVVMIKTMTVRKCVHEYMNFIARRPKAKIPTASLQFADAENRVKKTLDILAARYIFLGRLIKYIFVIWTPGLHV